MLLQRFGARKLMIAAGIMWGLGWFATGMAGSIIMLYASFGILAGCASGFGYNPGVVTAVSWFPDKRDLLPEWQWEPAEWHPDRCAVS